MTPGKGIIMHRRDHRPRSRDWASDPIWTMALAVAVTVLLTVYFVAMCMLELERYGPDVGAIVVFRPSAQSKDMWRITASVDDTAGAALSCTLSPTAMAVGGGSLVVEARRMSSPPIYRVHWAGQSTSDDSGNCGRQADLVLSRSDLQKLANTAGGYGIGPKAMGP
jgi:hypothetical protein